MKLGILIATSARDERFTNVDRLEAAAHARGYEAVRLYEPSLRFTSSSVFHDALDCASLDAIIYRPNFIEEPSLHTHVLDGIRRAGVRVINGDPHAVAVAKNKLLQHVRFAEQEIPCPRWMIAHNPNDARNAAHEIGFPVIMKTAFGTHGVGVFYAERQETFQPIADYLAVRDGNPIIIEEFIADADRKDLRVFVVGGRVAAAMERSASKDDIRANVARGGSTSPAELSAEESALVARVAEMTSLEILGIDILRTPRGPFVIEINANPGFDALEKTTGKDIAGEIIDLLGKHAA